MHTRGESPLRDDAVTVGMPCRACGYTLPPAGRRRYCSDACRQRAYRRRHGTPPAPPALPPRRSARTDTVYQCPSCELRLLEEQRCPDCHVFCRRIGPGGPCPHCEEPVAINDLLPPETKGG